MGCSQKYDFVDRFSNENFQKFDSFSKVLEKQIEYKNLDFIVSTKDRRWSDPLSGRGGSAVQPINFLGGFPITIYQGIL